MSDVLINFVGNAEQLQPLIDIFEELAAKEGAVGEKWKAVVAAMNTGSASAAQSTAKLSQSVDQVEQSQKDVATQAKVTGAAIDNQNKTGTESTGKLSKSIESLAIASKKLPESIVGGAYAQSVKNIAAEIEKFSTMGVEGSKNIAAQIDVLIGKEKVLQTAIANSQDPELIAQYEQGLKDTQGQINLLSAALDRLQASGHVFDSFKKDEDEVSQKTQSLTAVFTKTITDLVNSGKSLSAGGFTQSLKDIQTQLGLTNNEVVKYLQNTRKNLQSNIANSKDAQQLNEYKQALVVTNQQLKEFGFSEDEVGVKTLTLRTRLTQAREELAAIIDSGIGGPKLDAATLKVAHLADEFSDLQARVKVLGSDTKNIEGLISLASGVAGGFAVAQGAAALFGDQNEELQRALLKVNAAMSILQGLQQIQNVLQKESAASILLTSNAQKVNTTNIAANTVAEATNNTVTETNIAVSEADAAAKVVQATATEGATLAQKGLNLAMSLSPAGILLLVVTELIGVYEIFTSRANDALKAEEKLNREFEEQIKLNDAYVASIGKAGDIQVATLTNQGAKAAQIRAQETSTIKEQLAQAESVEASKRAQAEKSQALLRDVTEGRIDLNAEEIKSLKETVKDYESVQVKIFDLQKQLQLKDISNSTEQNKEDFKNFQDLQNAKVAATIAGSDQERKVQIDAIRAVKAEREKSAEFQSLDPEAQALARATDEKQIQALQLQNYQHYLKGRTASLDAELAIAKAHQATNDADQTASINKISDLQIAAIRKQRTEALANPTLNKGERDKINAEANLAIAEAEKKKQIDILNIQKGSVALQLAAVRKASLEESQLKLQEIEIDRQAEIAAAGKNADLKKEIDDKYLKLKREQERAYDEIKLQDEISLDNAALDNFGLNENQKLAIVLKRLEDQRSLELSQADGNAKKIAEVTAKYDRSTAEAHIASLETTKNLQLAALSAYSDAAIKLNKKIADSDLSSLPQKINALEFIKQQQEAELQIKFDTFEKEKAQHLKTDEEYNAEYQVLLNQKRDIAEATEKAITDAEIKEIDKRISKIKTVFSILQDGLSNILPQNAFSTAITEIENFAVNAIDIFQKVKVKKEELNRALEKAARPDATSADIANAKQLSDESGANEEQAKQTARILAVQAGEAIINQIYADSAAQRQEQLNTDLQNLEDQKAKELDNTKLTAQQKADVEARYREKERQVKIKAFQADKQAKETQAIINGILAGTAALPNLVLAGIAVAAGIAAAAQIASQPTPKFRHGAVDIDISRWNKTDIDPKENAANYLRKSYTNRVDIKGPGSTTSDSIPAWISNRESVIAAEPTAKWKEALQAINEDKFEGYLQKSYKQHSIPEMSDSGMRTTHHYVTNYDNRVSTMNRMEIDYDKLAAAIAAKIPEPTYVQNTIDENGLRQFVKKSKRQNRAQKQKIHNAAMSLRFTIIDRNDVATEIDEPTGFDSVVCSIKRDADWHGIMFSNHGDSYQFDGIALDLLKTEYTTYRAQGDMTLLIEEDCGTGFTEFIRGKFLFITYEFVCGDECYVKIDVENANEVMMLRNKIGQKVDLESLKAFDEVTDLVPYDALPFSMELPSKTIFVKDHTSNETDLVEKFNGSLVPTTIPLFGCVYNFSQAHLEFGFTNQVAAEIGNFSFGPTQWTEIAFAVNYPLPYLTSIPIARGGICVGDNIFLDPLKTSEIINFSKDSPNYGQLAPLSDLSFRFKGAIDVQDTHMGNIAFLFLRLKDRPGDYLNGTRESDYEFLYEEAVHCRGNIICPDDSGANWLQPGDSVPFDINYFNPAFELHDGDRIYAFMAMEERKSQSQIDAVLTGDPAHYGWQMTTDTSSFFKLENFSKTKPTQAKVFAINEVISRVTESITNDKLRAYSDYFGRTDSQPYAAEADGCGSLEVITDGLRIRRQENKIPGQTSVFAVSIQDVWDGLNPIHNIGMGLEPDALRTGFNRLRVEDWRFFYNDTLILECPDVGKITHKCFDKEIYSTFQFGYAKWEAEEYTGLDEFLTKRTSRTTLSTVKNDLIKLSKFVASGYAYEVTRRKGNSDSKDWRYDKETFIICCQRVLGALSVELGNVTSPENIIDPDSLLNYRISPMRNAMRWMNRVLESYAAFDNNSKIIFTDGDANYFAKGIMTSGECRLESNVIAENQTIDPSNYADDNAAKPFLMPERIVYEYPMSKADYKLLESNPYGKIYYSNQCEEGFGYIDSIDFRADDEIATFNLIPAVDQTIQGCVPVAIIGSTVLPGAVVGVPYSHSIPLYGSQSFDYSSVVKPAWMSVTLTGSVIFLTGTPTDAAAGDTVSFDVSNCEGDNSVSFDSTIDVTAPECDPVAFADTPELPDAFVNTSYLYGITLTGDGAFELSDIIKPAWMNIAVVSSIYIVFSGTPLANATAVPVSFTIKNCLGINSIDFSDTIDITTECIPAALTGSLVLPDGVLDQPYNYTITVSGTQPFSLSSIFKPAWMTLALSVDVITFSGTPTAGDEGAGIAVSFNVDNCTSDTVAFSDAIDVAAAGSGCCDLQDVSDIGSVTDNLLTMANLNISDVKEFADNTAAILGGLKDGDVYRLPVDADTYHLAIVHAVTVSFMSYVPDTSMIFSAVAAVGQTITTVVDWGDGTSDTYTSAISSDVHPTHSYGDSIPHKISWTFLDYLNVSRVDLGPVTSIDNKELNRLAGLINMGVLVISNTGLTNFDAEFYSPALYSLGIEYHTAMAPFNPSHALPPGLLSFSIISQDLNGIFDPAIALPNGLTELNLIIDNLFNGLVPVNNDLPLTLEEILLDYNGMSVAAVNNTLVYLDSLAFSGSVNTISITQFPSALPTGAGATAKASLEAKGWTVITT